MTRVLCEWGVGQEAGLRVEVYRPVHLVVRTHFLVLQVLPCDCLRCVMGWYVLNPNSRVFTGALSGCRVDSVNGPDEAFKGGGACND